MMTLRLLLLFALALPAFAATLPSDGSQSDVQSKINSAVDGDTVTIPAGTFTWTTGVAINAKQVHLRGAGSGRVKAISWSSVTFGTGTKTFTALSANPAAHIAGTGPGLANGTTIRVWKMGTDKDSAYMLGTVTSCVGTALELNITTSTGSGTKVTWLFAIEHTTKVRNGMTNAPLLTLTEATAGSVQVSGIQFDDNGSSGVGARFIDMAYTANGKPILIHDSWFNRSLSGVDMIRNESTNRGVLWNLTVTWTYTALSDSQFLHLPVNARTESWASVSTMGTADTNGASNIYVEDCDIHGNTVGASDFDANTRIVWRKCMMNHAALASHGYDTGPYGVRHWEIYDNAFMHQNYGDCDGLTTASASWHVFMRGGTGVITGNYFYELSSCANGDKREFNFGVWALERWIKDPPGAYSADDGGVVEYPCPRQFGMGYVTGAGVDGEGNTYSQPSGYPNIYVGDAEPTYEWSNTYSGTRSITISTDGDYGHAEDNVASYIVAGRDYYLDTAKPGWSRSTYPNPWRTDLATGTITVTTLNVTNIQLAP